MLIDMIHDNHGEPPFKTRYRDPQLLANFGYHAIVIPEALAAIPAAHEPPKSAPPLSPKPRELEARIDAQVQAARAANMQIFFYGDALLLPRSIVMKRPADFLCDDPSGNLCPAKPAVYAALKDQIEELFDRWPAASGLIMRTGEVYPESTPHMLGSPLAASACPTCRHIPLQDRLLTFITTMHDVVIADLKKIYIHRAFQPINPLAAKPLNIHDDPEAYRALSARLPDSKNLHFSFKFTRGDFQPGQPFNPCLLADHRTKWIEFQCEREFEGKGAFPNYQAPLWQKFLEHLIAAGISAENLHERFNLWGWSRGGGWGGPYVQREEWIDANVYALAKLHQNPTTPIPDLATAWASLTFQIAESSPPAPALAELLLISAPTLQNLLHNPAPSAIPWLHDDLLDVNAIWSAADQITPVQDPAPCCSEKLEALRAIDRIRQLFDLAAPELPNKSQSRDLANSLAYYSSFASAVAHLFLGLVHFAQWAKAGRTNPAAAKSAAAALTQAQAAWQQHTQNHALLPGVPTVFRENTFWQHTHDCLEQLQASP